MGKQFIVDNRTGAGGVVGTEQGAHAPNDGYTLLIASLALTINPWFHKVAYNSAKSFAPVAILATAPNVISVQPDLPVKTAADLIALARKQPGKLQYASAGVGSFMHMGPELFKQMAKVDILHVPFRGAGTGADRRDGRQHPSVVRLGALEHHAFPLRQAQGASASAAKTATRLLPDVPTIDNPACPATIRQLDRHRRTGRHAAGDRRKAPQGADRRSRIRPS